MSGFWLIRPCDGESGSISVDISGGSPEIGKVILADFEGATPYGCYIIVEEDDGPIADTANSLGDFETCEECGSNYTGTTVNAFYQTTLSGATESINIPHPVYATENGVAIQLNAVELGGFNGVNN